MLSSFVEWYQETMVKIVPYEVLIHLEEVILVVAGIFIGILIMGLISAFFMRGLYKVDNFGKHAFTMVRVKEGKQTRFTVSFKNFSEAFQQILLLFFAPFFTVKSYTKRDEKRTKRFIWTMFVVGILAVAFSILSIATVFQSTF